MLKTYHGSCHCKAIMFEADLDLAAGTGRCNCTFCRKTRNWSAQTKPEHLRITKGVEQIVAFRPVPERPNEHCFCMTCGVRVFSRGDIPEIGGPFVSIAIPALDDATPEELIASPMSWSDGLHDNWWNPPGEVRHL
jgi:hypothetical protein